MKKELTLVPIVSIILLFFVYSANVGNISGNFFAVLLLFAVGQLGFFLPDMLLKEFGQRGLGVIAIIALAGIIGFFGGNAIINSQANFLNSLYFPAFVLIIVSAALREVMEIKGWYKTGAQTIQKPETLPVQT